MIGDLGGSSLEFMQIGKGKGKGESLMLGPLSLMEVGNDPKDLRKAIRAELKTSEVRARAKGRFFAVGGAWRTFAKINMELENYALQVLHGYQMNQGQIARTAKLCIDSLSNSTSRSMLESVDKRRAKHMPIAAIVLEELLSISKLDGVSISSAGLREGVLTDLTGAAVSDPLLDGVIAFIRLDHNQIAFGQALHEFIAPAFAPEADLFGSPAADVRIEQAACMMSDSAGRFHPDHRAQMAYDQALRAPYAGVSHAERAMIAYAVGCRYQKDFKKIFPLFSTLGVLGVVFVALVLKARAVAADPGQLVGLIVPLVILYAVNFLVSTIVGRLFFKRDNAIALVYGTVMRNLSIALAIAMTAFQEHGSQIALIIALAYIIQVQSAAWYVKLTDRIFGPAPEAKVQDIMLEGVFALHLVDTLHQAIKLLAEEHIHSLAILDADSKPVGMISADCVIDAMADGIPYDQPLSSMRLEPVLIASGKTLLRTVLADMKRTHEYKALVLDDQGKVSYVVPHDEIMVRLATKG